MYTVYYNCICVALCCWILHFISALFAGHTVEITTVGTRIWLLFAACKFQVTNNIASPTMWRSDMSETNNTAWCTRRRAKSNIFCWETRDYYSFSCIKWRQAVRYYRKCAYLVWLYLINYRDDIFLFVCSGVAVVYELQLIKNIIERWSQS